MKKIDERKEEDYEKIYVMDTEYDHGFYTDCLQRSVPSAGISIESGCGTESR